MQRAVVVDVSRWGGAAGVKTDTEEGAAADDDDGPAMDRPGPSVASGAAAGATGLGGSTGKSGGGRGAVAGFSSSPP